MYIHTMYNAHSPLLFMCISLRSDSFLPPFFLSLCLLSDEVGRSVWLSSACGVEVDGLVNAAKEGGEGGDGESGGGRAGVSPRQRKTSGRGLSQLLLPASHPHAPLPRHRCPRLRRLHAVINKTKHNDTIPHKP